MAFLVIFQCYLLGGATWSGDKKLVSQIFHHSKHLCFEPSQHTMLLYAYFSEFSKYSKRWRHLVVIRNRSVMSFIILNIFPLSTFSIRSL